MDKGYVAYMAAEMAKNEQYDLNNDEVEKVVLSLWGAFISFLDTANMLDIFWSYVYQRNRDMHLEELEDSSE